MNFPDPIMNDKKTVDELVKYADYLSARWQDEKEYEDWKDYEDAFEKKLKLLIPNAIPGRIRSTCYAFTLNHHSYHIRVTAKRLWLEHLR